MTFPSYLEKQPHIGSKGNRGLYFQKFFNGYESESWEVPKDAKKKWIDQFTKDQDTPHLLPFIKRQRELIAALEGRYRIFKTNWNFVTGLGLPHPVEVGFSWHHTLGVPYLAASGVSGMLRAWIEQWEDNFGENETKESRIADWFGTEECAGRLIFFDALPIESVKLTCDIITPHHSKWNEQPKDKKEVAKHPPGDWSDPVPIPFLAVAPGTKFFFALAMRNALNSSNSNKAQLAMLDEAFKCLERAMQVIGAGAKTSAGYGRMNRDTEEEKKLE